MTDHYPLSEKQIYGSDVDDDDLDAIYRAMDKLDKSDESTAEDKNHCDRR